MSKERDILAQILSGWDIFIDSLEKEIDGYHQAPYTARKQAFEAILTKAKNLLALPPRNCDVGTPKEQVLLYCDFCKSHYTGLDKCKGCPLYDPLSIGLQCLAKWLQMPYKEKEKSKPLPADDSCLEYPKERN